MKELQLIIANSQRDGLLQTDYRIDRTWLGRHLATGLVASIVVAPKFARQLLGEDRPELASGRIPIFVCEACGDLGCGAIAVRVSAEPGVITWSDFAFEDAAGPLAPPDPILTRTGPLRMSEDGYTRALSPFAKPS